MENGMRKVKIKTWEKMEKEFGVSSYGDLKCDKYYTKVMEDNIPENRIIEIGDNEQWYAGGDTWFISEDMIEEYLPEETSESLEQSQPESETLLDIWEDDVFAINLNALESIAKANHIHYLKWKLNDNLSIRFFYNFETKPEMINKFALKNHKQKELVEISKETAREMICSFCIEKFEEIIGYNVKGFGYKKYVKKFGEDFKILKNDK